MSWYRFFQRLLGLLVRAVARVEVVGMENLPPRGPFILVANHQSVLDPIIVQGICPRPLHTLTKSTQFGGRLMRWALPRVNAIPTRRYRVEPQAVRVVLRRLAAEEAVGIYPEGERSWDGALQPFRRGTMRLILKAGVPVVPCGVVGSYDVWPRWSRSIRRRRVRVAFGEALQWPAIHDRFQRDALVDEVSEAIGGALRDLSSWDWIDGAVPGRSVGRAGGKVGGRGKAPIEGLGERDEPEWLRRTNLT